MRVAELKQKNNSRQIVVPRQIAMYLAKQLTEASLPEIGGSSAASTTRR
jgi:chromosomal replication initiator protein